jgi:hypothetical protein
VMLSARVASAASKMAGVARKVRRVIFMNVSQAG